MRLLKNIFFFRGFEYVSKQKLKEKLKSMVKLTAGGTVAFYGIGLWSNNAKFYESMVMPAVRWLDPEMAHRAAVLAAKYGLVPRDRSPDLAVLRTSLWGLEFDNPVGLAAGFDKHGEACDGMLDVGFGFVEVGSVTPQPQPGNPQPRVFRLEEDDAVINRYGFNSEGHAAVVERLRARREAGGLVGVNLGKNKLSADAAADYVAGVNAFAGLASYFVINVSSPNTPGLRELQKGDDLERLLDSVLEARDAACPPPGRPPVLLKIAPDLSAEQRQHVAQCALARKERLGGLIVSNTTISRDAGLRSPHAAETGGLSGRPLQKLSTDTVADMYRLTNGQIPIVGVGGVFSGEDAYQKVRAGASLVQLYTSLAVCGPPIVGEIKRQLAELLTADGFSSVSEAVGADHRPGKTRTNSAAIHGRAVSEQIRADLRTAAGS
ncbi:Dihydroorotate dehydrogenase (quinone), mitochondrial [Amphibalanus amphitrite]|uniref:Dihydroorotate dehydrogenase (quinone), mitochondrial n=1 Tax=Amphibalanus amphitrite TaxID=1232801 RepID=A0A6A4VT92_AMPAM|nr:dihydroorotate dehydrogenase (quinone)-like [Amphibalanus amphitrite]XP_043219842.1 dihydroorotate dehydrogenase (quinone)-like [Amphibalanus amphitrite]XP_043219843.1 dihydroorotate dehydrogenase (quinone)-like [Amphibalanus amphitrite]KAF0298026.1 Dihydroorotate dehydrogenase (quinone), mitochondrial [Amphibalanus amphitrite]